MPQKRVEEVVSFLRSVVKDRPLSVLNIGGTPSDYHALREHLKIGRYVCVNPGADEAGTGYEVWPTSIEKCDKNAEPFDLICLFGTLNHLLEPQKVFSKISGFMNSQSIFVFDYKDPVNKMERMRYPTGALQFDHSTYPTFKTLGVLLNSASFELITHQTLNKRLYTFATRLSNELKTDPLFDDSQRDTIANLKKLTNGTPTRLLFKSVIVFLKRKLRLGMI